MLMCHNYYLGLVVYAYQSNVSKVKVIIFWGVGVKLKKKIMLTLTKTILLMSYQNY